jgi:hypothetical protein
MIMIFACLISGLVGSIFTSYIIRMSIKEIVSKEINRQMETLQDWTL